MNLVAELAPHDGYPQTDIFDHLAKDGSRRSVRAKKPTAKTAFESTSPPPKSAQQGRRPKIKPLKRSRANKSNRGRRGNPKPLEPAPPPSASVEPQVEPAVELYPSGLEPLHKPGFDTPRCNKCSYVCYDCAELTAKAVNLIESPRGHSTWYVGRHGIFEIGLLRFPRIRKSMTYVRSGVFAETWCKDDDRIAVQAELELESINDDDSETVDGDLGEEELKELQEQEEVDVGELIKEWCDFCSFGQDKSWGSWLDPTKRPAHIDEAKWNEWRRQRLDDLNARHEARIAANPTRSWP